MFSRMEDNREGCEDFANSKMGEKRSEESKNRKVRWMRILGSVKRREMRRVRKVRRGR